jgi:hypothetical protein
MSFPPNNYSKSEVDELVRKLADEQEFSRQQVRLVATHASHGERQDEEIERLKERERSLMRQLDLARATIAFQAYGIPKRPLESSESANRVFTAIMSLPIVEDPK